MQPDQETAYIAGPMRDHPYCNFPQFDDVASYCRRTKGWKVWNPAEHDREIAPEIEQWPGFATGDLEGCPSFDFHKAMQWDLVKVAQADHLVLLPGWENSTGARHELDTARATGSKIWLAIKARTQDILVDPARCEPEYQRCSSDLRL
jgi:hypothetical protein